MLGYWRNREQTGEALRGGWLYTGDLGWLDDDGFLYFVDRKKDVIRRRGENISSQQVEDAIKDHPNVLDCAVIAVPSELGEDEVKAYVLPRPGASVPRRRSSSGARTGSPTSRCPATSRCGTSFPALPACASAKTSSARNAKTSSRAASTGRPASACNIRR